PDVNKVGGTEVVLEVVPPADEDAVERARQVLQRRFDERGTGVEVRRDGVKQLAVVVPNGKWHDTFVMRARRLGATRGQVEFRMLAHLTDDAVAMAVAEERFLAMKDLPAKPGGAGDELTVGLGAAKRRYRWFRLSDGQARDWTTSVVGRGGG